MRVFERGFSHEASCSWPHCQSWLFDFLPASLEEQSAGPVTAGGHVLTLSIRSLDPGQSIHWERLGTNKRLSGGKKARVLNILLHMLSFLPLGRAPVRNRRWALTRQEGESGTQGGDSTGPATARLCLSAPHPSQLCLPTCSWKHVPSRMPALLVPQRQLWNSGKTQTRSQGLTLPLIACTTLYK